MRKLFPCLWYILWCLLPRPAAAQEIFKEYKNDLATVGMCTDIKQDKQGFFWIIQWNNSTQQPTVSRFDGSNVKKYVHNPDDPGSISKAMPYCLYIDEDNYVWIGTYGMGVDRLDPATGMVTHFRKHQDSAGLSSDTVLSLAQDGGNLWIGTNHGLTVLHPSTGTYRHYEHRPGDSRSLPADNIFALFKDSEGTLWAGAGPNLLNNPTGAGGLCRYNQKTDDFTHFEHSDADPTSLADNKVLSLSEDRSGRFWIGLLGGGLDLWDRRNARATHFPSDTTEKAPFVLNRYGSSYSDHVTFVKEDAQGVLWIGSIFGGLLRYDTITRQFVHYGTSLAYPEHAADTSRGYVDNSATKSVLDKEGLLWIASLNGNIFSTATVPTGIPFVTINADCNAFYQEPGGTVLWVGTSKGLLRKDLVDGSTREWVNDPKKMNGLPPGPLTAIKPDESGGIWISTIGGGVCRLDLHDLSFKNFRHEPGSPNSLLNDSARNVIVDSKHNLWIPFWGEGLDMLDLAHQRFEHYPYETGHPRAGGLKFGTVETVYEDEEGLLWVGDVMGVSRLDRKTRTFHYYPSETYQAFTFCSDARHVLWVGTASGLYRYDRTHDVFVPFPNPATGEHLTFVTGIQEDDRHNLWLRTGWQLISINERRDSMQIFGPGYGVKANYSWISRFTKGKGDELYFGTLGGYYDFFPEKLVRKLPPNLSITQITIGNHGEGEPLPAGALDSPLFKATNVNLAYGQHSFTVWFYAMHLSKPGPVKYQVMLENYDHGWLDPGQENKISFFSVPPGRYLLHVKATDVDGESTEKTLLLIIHPPWYRTWWAFSLFVLLFVAAVWAFIDYRGRSLVRQNKQLEDSVHERTTQLEQSLEELKATQRQLIQSEKMASLGELTAGIAHEIQNPLNFVNNFSEINTELLDEMEQELKAGNTSEALLIAEDIRENESKINAHGKRADAIVKGMLLHSRTSSGSKEPTDLNALTDEYFRLSYHGLRAKDKTFNATMRTDFDSSIGMANVIPQDMGRVLLNMFTNAFYSVSEKRKHADASFEPMVCVNTKRAGDKIEIRIRDNGMGVPQKIIDKIFQPFFTTKPTGEGTGLGLSLSYDIVVKAHNGRLSIDTKEGEYAEFLIVIPA